MGKRADGLEVCWHVTGIAVRERLEAEVEDAVEFVEGDAHVEAELGGGDAVAAGLLHERKAFEVEPASSIFDFRFSIFDCGPGRPHPGPLPFGMGEGVVFAAGSAHDCRNGGGVFICFESGAERGDTVFDEVEASALHDVVFVVVGGGDDFFGDAEGGADFAAGEFAVFEELEVGGGERRLYDFATVGEKERTIG